MRRGSKSGMYLRRLYRAAVLRKGQAISALIAILVAAAAATAMLTLYVDVQTKLQREFRNFGANVVVQARAPQGFSPQDLQAINAAVSNRGFAVPFAYAVARTPNDQAVIVAGTDFALARKLNPWWSVSAWPRSQGEALVGARASRAVGKSSAPFTLTFHGHPIGLTPAGPLSTGGGEDSRLYVSLPEFQAWTGLRPSTVEIAASGTPAEVNALLLEF